MKKLTNQWSRMRNALGMLTLSSLLAAPYVSAELIGVSPQLPLINFSGTGTTEFNANSGLFEVDSAPIALVLPPVTFISDADLEPKNFEIKIKLDQNGNLLGGVNGADLIVEGAVDLDGNGTIDVNGVLLTGEIAQFGFRDTGTVTDLYDFVFTVSGGELDYLYAGYDIAVSMNSEASNFTGSFDVNFSGKSKGQLGAIEPSPVPQIEICTLVTLNDDALSDFSDADNVMGDACDSLAQGMPSGLVGDVNGTYKLKVTNIGNEALEDVVINAPDFGLVNEPIPASCGTLEPSEVCVIEVTDPNQAYQGLGIANVCLAPGAVSKDATVSGKGEVSGIAVNDDDPAVVNCIAEPYITLLKEVKIKGKGVFVDANTPATGPTGSIGADAVYRLTVKNDGTEALYNVVVNDPALGINNVVLNVDPFLPGDMLVLTQADAGFAALNAVDRCDIIGELLNIASVEAMGVTTGGVVNSEDPAYITCENPQIELLKQVSIDGVNFFDADLASDIDVPVGVVGSTNARYRLIVTNIGTETLTNVLVADPKLGIERVISDLAAGETQMIDSGEIGFAKLDQQNVCEGSSGNKSNIASVMASGVSTELVVSDENPANVRCITGPEIEIKKQVRLKGSSEFLDADTPETGPSGLLGDDAIYRFIVKNIGDENLRNVTVQDNKLNIPNTLIADLPVGAQVTIKQANAGFENLNAQGYCDKVGSKVNVARVTAVGAITGSSVSANDPAYISCSAPVKCKLSVDQTCSVKTQASSDKLCTDKISATTLRYTGPNKSNATVTFANKNGGIIESYSGVNLESNVTILTKPSTKGYTIDLGVGAQLDAQTMIKINGVEEIIHTSCSAVYYAGQPAPLDSKTPNPANSSKGDPSPNWSVVNFRQKDDVIVAESSSSSEGADSCDLPFGGAEVTYGYKVRNTGSTKVNVTSVLDSKLGEMLSKSPKMLSPGDVFTLKSKPVFITKDTMSSVDVSANVKGASSVVCPAVDSAPVIVAPAPLLSCADGKPVKLGITYVGGSCSDSKHNQGSSKSSCSGNSKNAEPVLITFTDKKGGVLLSERVNIGDTVILDNNGSKFDSETNVSISKGGKVIQSINFHTSCSVPLVVGDQHGGIVISSFTPEANGSGKGSKGKGSKAKGSKGKDKKAKGKGSKGKKDKKAKGKGSKGKKDKSKGSKGKKSKGKK